MIRKFFRRRSRPFVRSFGCWEHKLELKAGAEGGQWIGGSLSPLLTLSEVIEVAALFKQSGAVAWSQCQRL